MLGLGAMGARMARCAVDAGHEVTVWNRSPGPVEALVEAGARRAVTPREAADGAEIVLSIVADDEAARAVWLDAETGAVDGMAGGAVAVESSTTTVAWIGELRAAVEARGAHLLDAPVVGSRPHAEAGELLFLAGGDEALIERARPLFEALGRGVVHAGPSGRGTLLKLVNNAHFLLQMATTAELHAMLERSGLEPQAARALVEQLPVAGPIARLAEEQIAGRRFETLFSVDLCEKDLRYAVETARSLGGELPLVEACRVLYERTSAAGWGNENASAVAKLFLPPDA